MGWGYYGFRKYVPVAQKLARGVKHAAALAKKQGREPAPVKIEGRKIAKTFWGQSWCDNLEAYSDYANRLPRGAAYVRNGSVVDLVIKPRRIEAIVSGSEAYTVAIDIAPLPKGTWQDIKQDCSTSIDSLLDLLAGRFSDGVMQRLTRQDGGLFPAPKEIQLKCSCPDYSYCCKHLAAVMYGVGARLDNQPELLFTLREVDPQELVSQAVAEGNLDLELGANQGTLADQDLQAIFGIELETDADAPKLRSRTKSQAKSFAARKPATRKLAGSKAANAALAVHSKDVGKTVKDNTNGVKATKGRKPASATAMATQAASKKSQTQKIGPKQKVASPSRLRNPKRKKVER